MRDIYLIDFENVASEGLNGITYLAPEDEVIIFYSNNSKSLSMKMHILIGKSVCKLSYFEATVGGKNALDHQISTWLGYLVGKEAAERNYYIVSRDMGYKFVASFWAGSEQKPSVRCVESIRAAGRLERKFRVQEIKADVREDKEPEAKTPQLLVVQPEAVASQATEEPVVAEAPVVAAEPMITAEPVEEAALEIALETAPADEVEAAPAETEPTGDQIRTRSYRGRQRYRRNRKNPRQEQEPQESLPVAAQENGNPPAPKVEAQPQPQEQPQVNTQEQHKEKVQEKAQASAQEHKEKPQANAQEQHKEKEQPKEKPQEKVQEQPKEKPQGKPQNEQKAEHRGEKKPEQKGRKPHSPRTKQEEPRRVELGTLLVPYPELQEQQLQQLIADNKRQVLCNTLRKLLGQEKGLALYNEIKKSAWR